MRSASLPIPTQTVRILNIFLLFDIAQATPSNNKPTRLMNCILLHPIFHACPTQ